MTDECVFVCVAVQVEACRSEMLYVVNVVGKDGSVLSEVAFNSQTGCIGANTVQVRQEWFSLQYQPYTTLKFCSLEQSRYPPFDCRMLALPSPALHAAVRI